MKQSITYMRHQIIFRDFVAKIMFTSQLSQYNRKRFTSTPELVNDLIYSTLQPKIMMLIEEFKKEGSIIEVKDII